MRLVSEGFKVAVISRDSSRLERLQSFVSPGTKDNLTTMVGNVGKLGLAALRPPPASLSSPLFKISFNRDRPPLMLIVDGVSLGGFTFSSARVMAARGITPIQT